MIFNKHKRFIFFLIGILTVGRTIFCGPVLVVTLPKGGTTHINASLCDYFGVSYEYGRHLIRKNRDGSIGGLNIIPENYTRMLKILSEKNVPIVDHFNLSDEMISTILSSGNKIVFVPRDPRAILTSMAIHQVLNSNAHDWKDQHLANQKKIQKLSEIRAFIDNLLQNGVHISKINELTKWMKWKKAHPNYIDICSFRLLKTNRNLFFRRILANYGVHYQKSKDFPGPGLGLCRFRNSPIDEWKTILTHEQKKQFERFMEPGLYDFYHWEKN